MTVWCLCGDCVVSVWCLCGVCVVTVWCLCGDCVVTVWCLCGDCVVTVWCLCGDCVVTVWCRARTRTPVVAGSVVTIRRDWFLTLGAYDTQLHIWGGDNFGEW